MQKPINVIYHVSKLKDNNMIILLDAENDFGKTQNLFLIKERLGIQGTHLNKIKAIKASLQPTSN